MLRRLAVIKKIGELKSPDSFALLYAEFSRHAYEAYPPSFEFLPLFRKHIIDAMARLNTGESRAFIDAELEALLIKGPRVGGMEDRRRKYAASDAYYVFMVTAMLKNLGARDDDPSSATIGAVCRNLTYPSVIREAAWYASARREIRRRGLDQDIPETLDYLLGELTGPGVGSKSDFTVDGKTTESTKNSGIMDALMDLGPDCLPYLELKEKEYARVNDVEKFQCVQRAKFVIGRKKINRELAAREWEKLK